MIYFLTTIISLLIGFYLGRNGVKVYTLEGEVKDTENYFVKKAKNILRADDGLKAGVIKRPTAQQLYEKNKEPERKAGLNAMKKTLDKIPELSEQKDITEKLKKAGLV